MTSVNKLLWSNLLDSVKELDENSQLLKNQTEQTFEQLISLQAKLNLQFKKLQQAETDLRRHLEYTNTMVDNLNEMFYTYDRNIRLTFINKKCIELLGYRPDELIGIIGHRDIFLPEDWEWITREAKARLENDSCASYIMPVLHRDGSKRHLKINSASLKAEGRIVGGMVLAEDITDEVLAIEALRSSEHNLRRITDNMLDFICELDFNGQIIYASPSHFTVMGFPPDTIMGMRFREFLHPDDLEESLEVLSTIKQSGRASIHQHRCRHAEGHYLWIETVGNPIMQNEQYTGVILSSRDISERKQLEDELRFLSVHDALTQLYNRSYFEEEINRLEGGRQDPVGIMVFDLDGLKLVNDTLGHVAGDGALIQTGQILRKTFRQGDVISRVGGDEFAVILPNTGYEVLEEIAVRFHGIVKEYNLTNPQLPLGISVGMAVRDMKSKSLRDTYKEADSCMYRVKLQSSRSARSAIVQTLLKALESRDYIIDGHGERMRNLALQLGASLGLAESSLSTLSLLAQFHDLGKVSVPDRILFKEAILTKEEYQEMQRHSEVGQRIALASAEMANLADLILKHHEWWNGAGYPLGLAGEDIPLECRIIALADAYDAMTSNRPYRKALLPEEAKNEIRRCAGTQFDPELAALFLDLLE